MKKLIERNFHIACKILVLINPKVFEAQKMICWYDSECMEAAMSALSSG
jgi:hypothetical protein